MDIDDVFPQPKQSRGISDASSLAAPGAFSAPWAFSSYDSAASRSAGSLSDGSKAGRKSAARLNGTVDAAQNETESGENLPEAANETSYDESKVETIETENQEFVAESIESQEEIKNTKDDSEAIESQEEIKNTKDDSESIERQEENENTKDDSESIGNQEADKNKNAEFESKTNSPEETARTKPTTGNENQDQARNTEENKTEKQDEQNQNSNPEPPEPEELINPYIEREVRWKLEDHPWGWTEVRELLNDPFYCRRYKVYSMLLRPY